MNIEICLYGGTYGGGWIAFLPGRKATVGDGTPKEGRSLTATIWDAIDFLRDKGHIEKHRPVEATIFAPSGNVCAAVDLNGVFTYANLPWQKAPVFIVSAEEIMKHAEVPA